MVDLKKGVGVFSFPHSQSVSLFLQVEFSSGPDQPAGFLSRKCFIIIITLKISSAAERLQKGKVENVPHLLPSCFEDSNLTKHTVTMPRCRIFTVQTYKCENL